jgi:alanyl-tRNA synthetase
MILQELFGKHITQKGSLIVNDKFRFDTNLERGLTEGEINIIENKMNKIIEESIPVNVKYIPLEELKKMPEEEVEMDPHMNYENIVRIIEIKGIPLIPCGGTHVTNTSEIKNFKIIKNKSHGKGIKRFEVECNF